MAIVLVHGSHFNGALWDKCLPFLGKTPLAVHLPGRPSNACPGRILGFADYAAAVTAQMDLADIQSAAVVGHSLAGATLCALAHLFPERIDQLIFLSAVVPRQNQRVIDALSPGFQTLIQQQHEAGAHDTDVPDAVIPLAFNDCSPEQIEFALRFRSPEPLAPYFETVPLQGIQNRFPCTYIKLLQDQIFTPDMQDGFIRHIPACRIRTMETGHFPMISRPQELAELINQLIVSP